MSRKICRRQYDLFLFNADVQAGQNNYFPSQDGYQVEDMDVLIIAVVLLFNILAAGHALLYKRDPKAAWGWIVTCLLIPTIGPVLYFLFGINRIRLKARRLKSEARDQDYTGTLKAGVATECSSEHTKADLSLVSDDTLSRNLSRIPLIPGNEVRAFFNGNEAYPEMIQAIERAQKHVYLSTYIFSSDPWGQNFIAALSRAVQRGVQVRVLLDAIGEFYSWPRAGRYLKAAEVPFARFLRLKLFPPSPFLNLRNHRKILVVDGYLGFTGGMNIRDSHVVEPGKTSSSRDIHFSFKGPVVAQFEDQFLSDWAFSTGESIAVSGGIQTCSRQDSASCRTISIGPDQDVDLLRVLFTGLISQARKKILIMTPYFLPCREIMGALQVAALRGVEVNLVLPRENNLFFIKWASQNVLWEILKFGVNVYYQPPPFDHSKIFVLDDYYTLVG
ncbi:MAG: phospholipase D-like domain-containing protein, partial [Desulfonatronovibrionaceae bacterium]